MELVTNAKVKELSKLRQKKYRDESNLVLIEGRRTIKQLLTDGIPILELYATEEELARFSRYLNDSSQAERSAVNSQIDGKVFGFPEKLVNRQGIFLANEQQLNKLGDSKSPQKIVALVKKKTEPIRKTDRFVFVERISDPGNLGTIIRTAKATGMDGVLLSPGCCDLFNPKTVRASVGSVFSVPSMVVDYDYLKELPGRIIVTDTREGNSLYDIGEDMKPFVLVVGSEASGISGELRKLAKDFVRIPMLQNLESLNAAVAAALCMYQLNRSMLKQQDNPATGNYPV